MPKGSLLPVNIKAVDGWHGKLSGADDVPGGANDDIRGVNGVIRFDVRRLR